MVEDPVCGLELSDDQIAATSDYEGQRYFFCSEECCAEFEAEPQRYMQDVEPVEYQL